MPHPTTYRTQGSRRRHREAFIPLRDSEALSRFYKENPDLPENAQVFVAPDGKVSAVYPFAFRDPKTHDFESWIEYCVGFLVRYGELPEATRDCPGEPEKEALQRWEAAGSPREKIRPWWKFW